ncbi:MAG: cell division protein FtsA [Clostridiales bacterium]|uniref:cell division protein FtsA n=1 Tax=Clostridium sp. N3C TaxID=1776758 RepID=UPI00092E012C|nr:cell division protein FtsA [Clostridium sp. N3C]NLZ48664.1 cell division protein FtsA [Clostridiales bacterium]SCN22115.1 Cell division protein FtsA [Clostridium sp. N3C]
MNNLLVAFDIGSSKISAVVAKVDSLKQMQVIAVTSVKNYGIEKSVVVNIEQTTEAIKLCKAKLESLLDEPINKAYINVNNALCKIVDSRVTLETISGKVVTEDDINKALNLAKDSVLSENEEVLWVYPFEYIVDNHMAISNPLGLRGKELSLNARIFTANKKNIENLVQCVQAAGIQIKGMIPQSLALQKLVVNDENKDKSLGVIDIGAESTDLFIYENGSIIYTGHIPLGGNNITKDILTCLSISFEEAENIKVNQKQLKLERENGTDNNEINIYDKYNGNMIDEIIEARADELLSFALEEIHNQKSLKSLDYIFITGGGIIHYQDTIKKFEEGIDKSINFIENDVMEKNNYVYSIPMGMLKLVLETITISRKQDSNSSDESIKKRKKGIMSKLKHFIQDFR